jgi:hypothetical protein
VTTFWVVLLIIIWLIAILGLGMLSAEAEEPRWCATWAAIAVVTFAAGIAVMINSGLFAEEIPDAGCWHITTDTDILPVGRTVVVVNDRAFQEVPCP